MMLAFVLFLVYRFLAAVVVTALLLATGLLLAVALSAPVEALHRHKVPRTVAVAMIAAGILAALGLGAYLLLPVLTEQASQLASVLPRALSQLIERAQSLAHDLGIKVRSREGEGISASTLANPMCGFFR